MEKLSELLQIARAADGRTRMDYRDRIASHGIDAIRGLEPWLVDERLAPFAVRTIERASAEPGAAAFGRAALLRALGTSRDPAYGDIEVALRNLGCGRLTAAKTSAKKQLEPLPGACPEMAGRALGELVLRWRSAGQPAQPGIVWLRDPWLVAFPKHASLLRSLPIPLDRDAVRSICGEAIVDEESAERALLAVMVWGHGGNGNAQYRTQRVFGSSLPADRLWKVAQTLAQSGPLAAYRRFSDGGDCRLYGLGPAFGTKYLYFCQPEGQAQRALIHDSTVSHWLTLYAGLRLDPTGWSESTYGEYLGRMHRWAVELECRPDDAEMLIFRSMAESTGSQWR